MPEVELVEIPDFSTKSFSEVIIKKQPEKIYNLAAVSSVKLSFQEPDLTYKVNYTYFQNLLEATTETSGSKTRIFQCSSSEMFGNSLTSIQNEVTSLNPISPYGESKVLAHQLGQEYRKKGLFITNGILFNHESEYRKDGFLFDKITTFMANRKMGKKEPLELGTLDVSRDWGYAGDFVVGMERALEIEYPDDFVFATGTMKSILQLIQEAMLVIEDETPISELIKVNQSLARPSERYVSCGDYSKAERILGWTPETSFANMLRKIIEYKVNNKS